VARYGCHLREMKDEEEATAVNRRRREQGMLGDACGSSAVVRLRNFECHSMATNFILGMFQCLLAQTGGCPNTISTCHRVEVARAVEMGERLVDYLWREWSICAEHPNTGYRHIFESVSLTAILAYERRPTDRSVELAISGEV